jgi:hypothetical protein
MVEVTNAATLAELLDEQAANARQAHTDAQATRDRAEQAVKDSAALLAAADTKGQVLTEADRGALTAVAAADKAYLEAVKAAETAAAAAMGQADRLRRTLGEEHLQLQVAGAVGDFYGNPAGGTPAVQPEVSRAPRDRLKVAARAAVEPGEQVTGSGSVADSEGVLAVALGTNGPGGPRVRLGLGIYPEDKKSWRGANRGSTAVLDRATVEHLAAVVDQVIADAKRAGAEFADFCKRGDAAEDAVQALERRRFDNDSTAEDRIHLAQQIKHAERVQRSRQADLDQFEARLDADTRAALALLQRQIDATASHSERERLRLAKQTTASGLTAAEFEELLTLDDVATKPWRYIDLLRRHRPAEEAAKARADKTRADELAAKARPGTSSRWGSYRSLTDAIHSTEPEIAAMKDRLAEMDAQARPLSTDDAAALYNARAVLARYHDEFDKTAGYACATAVVPAGWGDVMIEAILEEEGRGKVTYCMGVRPPGAAADWSPGDAGGDPFRPTPGVMRKVVALLRSLLP